MDHKPDDPLSDSLAQEIESALAVEPSPEFLARVRTRIEAEPTGRRWRVFSPAWSFEPMLAVGILGVVMAIVIPSWLRPDPPAVVERPIASTSPAPPQRAVAEPVRLQPDTTTERAEVTVRRGRPSGRPAAEAPPFPEVLISANEQRAFALLLATIEQGRLPPLPAVTASEQTDPIEPPALVIADLVIEPLPQIAQLE